MQQKLMRITRSTHERTETRKIGWRPKMNSSEDDSSFRGVSHVSFKMAKVTALPLSWGYFVPVIVGMVVVSTGRMGLAVGVVVADPMESFSSKSDVINQRLSSLVGDTAMTPCDRQFGE